METNAFDLLLLPLLQWFVMIFASMALIRAVLISACHWWHRLIDDDCEPCLKTSHRGE
jgi:hypothetical protein